MPRESKGKPLEARTRAADLSYGDDAPPRKDGSLFIWTIIILLLIGFAIGCWIFSFYIFGHPEKAVSYSILTKLKKLDAPKRFEITAAPKGEFLTATQLWDRYNAMSNRELERASEALLRNYLRNYKLTRDRVPYVVGSFNILDSNELTDTDMFPSGVVALAQSTDAPQVLLEHVFTADERVIPILHRMLITGLNLRLDKNIDLSAVINVKRLPDGRLQFTAVPILYGNYAATTGSGTFSLEPPDKLNMAAGLPVLREKGLADAEQKLSEHRLRAGLNAAKGEPTPNRLQTQLVRVERPQPVNTAAVPAAPPSPTPLPPDAPVLPALPVNPTPAPVAETSPTPAGVPLEPFISPSPTPGAIAATAGGKWPTYEPGQMPRGRLTNVPDMTDLAARGVGGERIYLQGSFVVTASGPTRAVLRSQSAITETLGIGGRTSNTRIIVEFPSGDQPPGVGATFSRDSRRPFQITEVKKAADGQVNVYVREVTRAR